MDLADAIAASDGIHSPSVDRARSEIERPRGAAPRRHDGPCRFTGVRAPRVKPSIAAGFVLYVGYLAIFYTTWAINDVDYPTIGETTESSKLHYAFRHCSGRRSSW